MNQNSSRSKILILSSAESPRGIRLNNGFVKRLNARLSDDEQVEWHNYNDIGMSVNGGKISAYIIKNGRELTSFKAVYFKTYYRYIEQAAFIAEVLRAAEVPVTGSELDSYVPVHKLSQMARLASAGVPVPPTVYMSLKHYLKHYEELRSKLGEPFVFKVIDGNSGEDNYLVKNKRDLAAIVKANPERHFIAQTFIANDSDMRVLIIKGKIKLLIERRRKDDSTHLNNTSRGAGSRLVPLKDLDKSLQRLALKAAKSMRRDVAGVDLMLETGTGRPFVLEVNPSPQIASGAFQAQKLDIYVDYFKRLAAK